MKKVVFLILLLNLAVYPQWKIIQTNYNSRLFSIQFFDTLKGVIAGDNGLLLQSNDGGNSWSANENFLNSFPDFYSISIYNNTSGWICGRYGTLLKTTDRGATWIQKDSPGPYYFSHIVFLNDSLGWLCGETNALFRTKFGDGYWTKEYVTTSSAPFGYLYTKNGISGYIVGDSGRALKTTNHGYDWTTINTGVTSKLENVTFSNDNLGWIVGDNGTILKTSDGGTSWSLNNSFSQYHFTWVTFVSDSTGWIVGNLGAILKTTDAGTTWNLIPSGTTVSLRMVYFKDQNHGYIAGDSGKVLLYDTTFSIQENGKITNINSGSKTGNFEIYQNYPNPFNPSTLIRFNIPFSSYVKIEVFNVLGKKVKELLNEQKDTGSYDISFDSSGLASGVYFYKIEAKSINGKSEFSDSKKMIVLK
jgi:photosystem II stability/assembly factor-like uncharacterized protein